MIRPLGADPHPPLRGPPFPDGEGWVPVQREMAAFLNLSALSLKAEIGLLSFLPSPSRERVALSAG